MSVRIGSAIIVLAAILLSATQPASADEFGVRDSRTGTVKESLFPDPPACGGDHTVDMWFQSLTFGPQFSTAPWLVVPTKATIDQSGGSFIDVEIPLGQLGSGVYNGMVFTRCTTCTTGRCGGKVTATPVSVEIAAPQTFGASRADGQFGGLVNGKPVSIHDLTHNIVDEIKQSSFMDLTGAKEVVERLENAFIDRAVTSNDLSDVTFVQTVDDPGKGGKLGTKIVEVEDEKTIPGNASYAKFGFMGQEEEIYVGVDMSLKGLSDARKNPGDYYIFTIDGKLGVLNKADFVHSIIHEGFHAYLGGQYNTAKTSGGKGACYEEELEGFRVGNAAARALGLPEDGTVVGPNYGGCSNPNYKTQFSELVPGQEAKDPTRTAAPATKPASGKPKETSAVPQSAEQSERGFCRSVDGGLQCEGTPNYALACADTEMSGNGCSLENTSLSTNCAMDGGTWACSNIPPAVSACDAISCELQPAFDACFADESGYWCDQMPAWGLDCASATECTFSDPLITATAGLPANAPPLYVATQHVECSIAGTGEYQSLSAIASTATAGSIETPFDLQFGTDPSANGGAGPSLENGYEYAYLDPSLAASAQSWPGTSAATDALSDTLPNRGVIHVAPGASGLVHAGDYIYQMHGGEFASVNVQSNAEPRVLGSGVPTPSKTNIGSESFFSYHYPAYLDRSLTATLSEHPGLRYEANPCRRVLVPVDPNFTRTGKHGGNTWGEDFDDQWAIKRVGFTDDITSAWHLVDDNAPPVIVAVIDTGLDWHHADIDPRRIWRNAGEVPDNDIDDDRNGFVDDVIGWNFVGDDNKPWDYDGHGTAVTGIIAATHNEQGIAGVSQNATIMVLKGATNFGTTRASWIAQAVVYAVDNGAQVINLSLGGDGQSTMEAAALLYAYERGVLVVAASGNGGVELNNFGPGGSDHVLTVGATHTDDRAAAFSNFGDSVDLVAPGVDVLTLRARATDANYRPAQTEAYALGDYIVGEDKRYVRVSGTSFSTPIVSATAALVLSKHPTMKADALMSLLTQTASDIEAPGRDPYAGHGMLNPRAALQTAPDFKIQAEITAAALRPAEAPTRVQVTGTIDATKFKRAWVQIGPGENPGAWRFVGQKRKLPITNGTLAKIPLANFTQSGVWTIMVNVEDRFGVVKRASTTVNIP